MTETAADEQDLAKALDNVASAAENFSGSNKPQSDSSSSTDFGAGSSLPPIVPPNSPVAPSADDEPTLPPITPLEDPAPSVHSLHGSPTFGSSIKDDDTDTPSGNSDLSADTHGRDSVVTSTDNVPTGPLADIKNDALQELRPLVDKLNVSAEEKFDTYLLLIRSTDDTSLIAPAHDAAKAIEDEARRAEALLDIIKEIDYLSRQDKTND